MKKYKNAKNIILYRVPIESYRYEYKCPFCKNYHIDYTMDDSVIMFKCSNCDNKLKITSIKEQQK